MSEASAGSTAGESFFSGSVVDGAAADVADVTTSNSGTLRESSCSDKSTLTRDHLSVGSFKIIYLYVIVDEHGNELYTHKNLIKVGEATHHTSESLSELLSSCENVGELLTSPAIQRSARHRIQQQTKTANIRTHLLGAFLALRAFEVTEGGGKRFVGDLTAIQSNSIVSQNDTYTSANAVVFESFRDHNVHSVLQRSGFGKQRRAEGNNKNTEWFKITLEQALDAIRAVQRGEASLSNKMSDIKIVLRKEQEEAIKATMKKFVPKTSNSFEKTAGRAAENTAESVSESIVENTADSDGEADGKNFDSRDESDGNFSDDNSAEGNAAPKKFLWNAIMRFGKTITSFELIKRHNKKFPGDITRVLVITHRPVVGSGWLEDFGKVFGSDSSWKFSAKSYGETMNSIVDENGDRKNFVRFCSMQDLRGSFGVAEAEEGREEEWSEEQLREAFRKNADIFDTLWDLVILDEAQEGLATQLAHQVFDNISTKYELSLSGTPYDLMGDFDRDSVFNWTYVDEQKAKEDWETNPKTAGTSNPYASLPVMRINALALDKMLANHPSVVADNTVFSLPKFFETDDSVESVRVQRYSNHHQGQTYAPYKNEAAVAALLDQLCFREKAAYDSVTGEFERAKPSTMPFSKDGAEIDFADTLWVLPSIKACVAMAELLGAHPFFSSFAVVNASGDNDSGEPLKDVFDAIRNNKKTITLSCGKLTVGTTMPQWTAVMMMSNTSTAKNYMQTIFRSKSSGFLRDGRVKEFAHVFDLDPDRALKVIVGAAHGSVPGVDEGKSGEQAVANILEVDENKREAVESLLHYLPVIAFDGVEFREVDAFDIARTVNRIAIEKSFSSGFADLGLYDPKSFASMTDNELALFKQFSSGLGKGKNKSSFESAAKVIVSASPLSDAARNMMNEGKNRQGQDKVESLNDGLTDEMRQQQEELKAEIAQYKKAEAAMRLTFRAVSVRIPMMLMGIDPKVLRGVKDGVTLDNFAELIDEESWKEFMPAGFARFGKDVPSWESFKRFLNRAVFEGTCAKLLEALDNIDAERDPLLRPFYLVKLMETFQNPDKETVLTPWKVVNLQLSNTLGGLRHVDEFGRWYCSDDVARDIGDINLREHSLAPVWVDNGYNSVWANPESTFFDLNSKTGYYPLYAAVSAFYAAKFDVGGNDALRSDCAAGEALVSADAVAGEGNGEHGDVRGEVGLLSVDSGVGVSGNTARSEEVGAGDERVGQVNRAEQAEVDVSSSAVDSAVAPVVGDSSETPSGRLLTASVSDEQGSKHSVLADGSQSAQNGLESAVEGAEAIRDESGASAHSESLLTTAEKLASRAAAGASGGMAAIHRMFVGSSSPRVAEIARQSLGFEVGTETVSTSYSSTEETTIEEASDRLLEVREVAGNSNSVSASKRDLSDAERWSKIVAQQVFVNTRVPLSMGIARRVLGVRAFDTMMNESVVDLIELRKAALSANKGIGKKLPDSDWSWELVVKWVFASDSFETATRKAKQVMAAAAEDDATRRREILVELSELVKASDSKRFTAVLSNPAYQKSVEGNKRSLAVYHHFMNVAKTFSEFVSMIYPSKWTQGAYGEGIDEFREEELSSTRYVSYHDHTNAAELFANAVIDGGVNYFLWDANKTSLEIDCTYNGFSYVRKTLYNGGPFYRNPVFKSIMDKVAIEDDSHRFSSIVAASRYYGGKATTAETIEDLPEDLNGIALIYPRGGKILSRMVPLFAAGGRRTDEWTIAASKVAHAGSDLAGGNRQDRIRVSPPGEIHSDTFLRIGPFKNEELTKRCVQYLKTDFCNRLFALATSNINTTKKNYRFIPLVDFETGEILSRPGCFLDFSSPETLDEQLFDIYSFSKEERALLPEGLKPWKNKVDVNADM